MQTGLFLRRFVMEARSTSAIGRKRTSLREGTLAQVVKSTPHPELASPEAHAWHPAKSGSTSAC